MNNNETLVYNWEDAVRFIHEKCNLSENIITEVLKLEEKYMKSIGVIVEEENNTNLLSMMDGAQRMERSINLDNPLQRTSPQWIAND